MEKFDELVSKELSKELISRYPGRIFSLTQVHVSKDLSFAKIWVSSLDDVESLVASLNQSAGPLRKEMSQKIVARRVPRLYFVADETETKAAKIDRLFDELNKTEK